MGAFKYYAILLGGGGGHQKVTEDHDQKGGGMVSKNIGQTEGAQEGYNNSRINY